MKKSLFLLPLVAMMFASCADNDPAISVTDPVQDSGERSFLTVSLVAPSSVSRADYTDDTNNEDYKDGKPEENKVNSVRFYFFEEDGTAANAFYQSASGTYLSYIDWIPTASEQTTDVTDHTVEKIINATLTVSKFDGKLPEKVIAIINPTEELYADKSNKSLTEIQGMIADYYTGLHNGNFVITNTTYMDGSNIVCPTVIDEKLYQPTEELAQQNKLTIYVERVLARLDLYLDVKTTEGIEGVDDGLIQVGTYKVDDKEQGIYLKLLGWNIVNTPVQSRLVKKIGSAWDNKLFHAEGLIRWNSSEYFRSFWAINPETVERSLGSYTVKNGDKTADDYFAADKYDIPTKGNCVTAYMQENAAADEGGYSPASSDRTKVIFAGKLVNGEGKEIELVRWANRYYTADNLLIAAANALDLYYKESGDNGQTVLKKISANDLEFVGANETENAPSDSKEYFAYLKIKDATADNGYTEQTTWQEGKTKVAETPMTKEEVNKYIIDHISNVLYWNSGMTYYFVDVRHIAYPGGTYEEAEDQTKVPAGHFGVVRNHIYSSKITKITGLGTPVYNPDQEIFPQTTETDDNIMAAEIRVLQWRVVNQDYDITWPK